MAIEQVASRVLTPSLKEEGFRKQRHNWWRDEPRSWRAVTLRGSPKGNYGVIGSFMIDIAVSWPELGHLRPDGPGAWRGFSQELPTISGRPLPRAWWEFRDASQRGEVDEITESVREMWDPYGRRYLRACSDPESLCRHAASQREFDPWLILRVVEARLDNEEVVGALLDRCLDLRRTEISSPGERRIGSFVLEYELLARVANQLGRELAGADRENALAIVADVADPTSDSDPFRERQRRSDEARARELARHLGIEYPPTRP